jgi:hypothetical protein
MQQLSDAHPKTQKQSGAVAMALNFSANRCQVLLQQILTAQSTVIGSCCYSVQMFNQQLFNAVARINDGLFCRRYIVSDNFSLAIITHIKTFLRELVETAVI